MVFAPLRPSSEKAAQRRPRTTTNSPVWLVRWRSNVWAIDGATGWRDAASRVDRSGAGGSWCDSTSKSYAGTRAGWHGQRRRHGTQVPGPGKLSRWHLQNRRFCNLHVTQKAHTLAETDGEKWQTKMKRSRSSVGCPLFSFSVVAERPLRLRSGIIPAVIRSVAAIPGRRASPSAPPKKQAHPARWKVSNAIRRTRVTCKLRCATSDQPNRRVAAPISRRSAKQTFSIPATPELHKYADKVMQMKLATFKYRSGGPVRLGFMIDDNPQSKSVDQNATWWIWHGYTQHDGGGAESAAAASQRSSETAR